jgi:hypothetical protein
MPLFNGIAPFLPSQVALNFGFAAIAIRDSRFAIRGRLLNPLMITVIEDFGKPHGATDPDAHGTRHCPMIWQCQNR